MKRMLALFVCAALALALLPATALAEEYSYTMDFSQAKPVSWGGITVDFSTTDHLHMGTGWSFLWEHKTKTLTITNMHFTTTANIGIKLPSGSTLVLKGTNSVTAKGGDSNLINAAIYVSQGTMGSLTIKGDGSLTATGEGSTADESCGIYVLETLTVESGTIEAIGGKTTDFNSYGILAGGMTITGGEVTAKGGDVTPENAQGATGYLQVYSCGVRCRTDGITVENGTLNATGGTVTASINMTGVFSCGIDGKAIVINGGTVTANGGKGIVTPGVEGGITASKGITSDDCVRVNGGSLTATGEDSGIDTNIFELRGGSVVATGEGTDSIGIYACDTSMDDANHVITFLPGKASVFAGTLTAKGDAFGIYATLVSVSGGKVEITANGSDGDGIRASDMPNGEGGVIAASSVAVSGGSVKCTGVKHGINCDSGVTVTGGTLYATGKEGAVLKFAAKPTSVTATGSNTFEDPIPKLGAVEWDDSSISYIINGIGNAPLPLTLYLLGTTGERDVDDGHYPPTIVAPTKDTEVELEAGESGALSVSALDATGFQWQMRVPGGNWQDIPRATGATLTVSGDVEDGTEYRCFASNSYGNVASKTFTVRVAEAATVVEPTVEPPQTGDGHTVAGYAMIALLALVTAAAIYRKKRA